MKTQTFSVDAYNLKAVSIIMMIFRSRLMLKPVEVVAIIPSTRLTESHFK